MALQGADRSRLDIPGVLAMAIAAVVTGVTLRCSAFVPWGTDPASYILAGRAWAEASLVYPNALLAGPTLLRDLPDATTPFGFTQGVAPYTLVGWYPLGFPLLLAAAMHVGGAWAAYAVAPMFAGLLTWCAYLIASRLSTPWAGVGAAALVAASPVTLLHAVVPMSDLPAAALWALSVALIVRPGRGAAVAAGLVTAMAVMVRPNLAPLGVAVALLAPRAGGAREWDWRRLAAYAVSALPGPLLVLWSQDALYGGPFQTGYGKAITFDAARAPSNLTRYGQMAADLYGWPVLVLLGSLAAAALVRRRRPAAPLGPALALLAVLNIAMYLPYTEYEGWMWLRFLLPALVAVLVLAAAALDRARLALSARRRGLSWAAGAALAVVALAPRAEIRTSLDTFDYRRVGLMIAYLEAAAPRRGVTYAYLQSAAVFGYSRRPIVRMDFVPSERFERSLIELRAYGYEPLILIDHLMERDYIQRLYQGSPVAELDWPARAVFVSHSPLYLYDPADRERYLNGEPYPTDVVALEPGAPGARLHAPPQDGIIAGWPAWSELRAFRRDLDEVYRVALGRAPQVARGAPDETLTWMSRYTRYRLLACDPADAARKVLAQLEGREPEPACGFEPSPTLPPRPETVAFRRRLDDAYALRARAPAFRTYVDPEGEAVWIPEYLGARARGCTHAQAQQRTRALIDAAVTGAAVAPVRCGTSPSRAD